MHVMTMISLRIYLAVLIIPDVVRWCVAAVRRGCVGPEVGGESLGVERASQWLHEEECADGQAGEACSGEIASYLVSEFV